MDKAKPLPIFLTSVVVLLGLTSLLLVSRNQTLQQKNRSLLEESKKLGKTLETAAQANKELLARQTKDQKSLKEALENLKHENELLQMAIKKADVQVHSAVEEKSYLEEMLINKTKEIEILKGSPQSASVSSGNNANAKALEQKIRQKDEEIAKLGEQNKILSDKLARLYKTTNDRISEINVAKIALEETVSSARKKIEDEWNTVNLGSISVDKKVSPPPAFSPPAKKEAPAAPASAKKDGRVLAINEDHGFVVVDLGKVDDLGSDAVLTVNQNGQSIATLSVLEIRDVMSACNIKDLQDGRKIKVNDAVWIQR